MSILLGTIR